MLRRLRRYLWPRRQGEGDTAERGGYSENRAFLAHALPAAEWASEVIPEPRARLWRRGRGMPRTGTGSASQKRSDDEAGGPVLSDRFWRCPGAGKSAWSLEPASAGHGDTEIGSAPRAF